MQQKHHLDTSQRGALCKPRHRPERRPQSHGGAHNAPTTAGRRRTSHRRELTPSPQRVRRGCGSIPRTIVQSICKKVFCRLSNSSLCVNTVNVPVHK